MLTKLQQFFLVVAVVFVSSAGVQFLSNVVNIFETDLATWQIIINAGVMGVVAYLVAWLTPQNRAFGLGSKDIVYIVKGKK